MRLRDPVATLENEIRELNARFDAAVESRLTELLSDPEQLRAAILERAQAATNPNDLMNALRALSVVDNIH